MFYGGGNVARKKITVVGAGNVGATTAQRLAEKEIGDGVLVNIVQDMPQGKALDILESGPVYGYDSRISGTNGYEETKDSDIVVVTSGVARKPGMSRDDLLKINAGIVKGVVENVVKTSPNAILIIVSNPLDAMTYIAHKVSRFPKHRVIGMAGGLAAARFSAFIAMELNVSVENVHAFVLGGHGDTMVPSTRYTTVAGVSVEELIPKARLEAIVKDKKKILPCAALCEGEYGINGLFVGVPVKLGAKGIEQIFEIKLNAEESAALKRSADAVKTLCEQVDKLL